MTFGSGANGCLGHGNYNDVIQAKIVESLLGYEVVQVSCGATHVLAVTNEHEVFAWGRGDNGRLGLGSQDSFSAPQMVPVPDPLRPSSVHCGMDCSMILTLDNKLLCSGSNRYNKLALDVIGPDGNCSKVVEDVHNFMTIASHPVDGISVRMVAMGTSHTGVVTVEGQCYVFGSNQFGQLGNSEGTNRQPQLVRALLNQKVTIVACGDTFTVAGVDEGEVYSWGNSARGRLARPDGDSTPKKVNLSSDELFSVVSISCNHGNTLLATRPVQRTDSPSMEQ